MSIEEIAVALEAHGHEIGSLKHRMEAAEKSHAAINELAASVKVMAAELKNQGETMRDIKKDVTALGSKVDVLEARPGKRWDKLAETVLACLVTAIVAFLLGKAGL